MTEIRMMVGQRPLQSEKLLVTMAIMRSRALNEHAGEVGFPGGKPEPGDDDLLDGVAGSTDGDPGPAASTREELQLTLTALGYEPLEISRALRALGREGLDPAHDADAWLSACLRWLAREAA